MCTSAPPSVRNSAGSSAAASHAALEWVPASVACGAAGATCVAAGAASGGAASGGADSGGAADGAADGASVLSRLKEEMRLHPKALAVLRARGWCTPSYGLEARCLYPSL